jgi:hypothetical protein
VFDGTEKKLCELELWLCKDGNFGLEKASANCLIPPDTFGMTRNIHTVVELLSPIEVLGHLI